MFSIALKEIEDVVIDNLLDVFFSEMIAQQKFFRYIMHTSN